METSKMRRRILKLRKGAIDDFHIVDAENNEIAHICITSNLIGLFTPKNKNDENYVFLERIKKEVNEK